MQNAYDVQVKQTMPQVAHISIIPSLTVLLTYNLILRLFFYLITATLINNHHCTKMLPSKSAVDKQCLQEAH